MNEGFLSTEITKIIELYKSSIFDIEVWILYSLKPAPLFKKSSGTIV